MSKRLIVSLVIVILIAIFTIGIFVYKNNNKENNEKSDINNYENEEESNMDNNANNDQNKEEKSNKKILVVYYSAQSHTKAVAEKIAQNLNADIYEIIPEEIYTDSDLDWTNSDSRVSREYNDESLRNIKLKETKVNNWEEYDTVLIGYPIWWGIAAWPVNTFVKANDFNGKTVIPFCTSASSGIGQSGQLLQKETNSGNWQEGHRFSSSASDSDIQKWTDSIKQ